MHPVLFRIAGHPVETAGLLYLLATIVAGRYAMRAFRRHGWDPHDVLPGLMLTVIAAYIGARLHWVILFAGRLPSHPLGELLRPGGLSFFGGMALGSLAVIGYFRWKRLPVGEATDALAPIAPVLYAIFRLGCLLNGDDYGPPTTLPWGISFPEGSPPTSESVHPTPLYEILLMVPVFAWIQTRRDAGLPPGALVFELCVLMGLERFVVEFWRLGPDVALGLTASQWLALALVAVGMIGRYGAANRRRRRRVTGTGQSQSRKD